MLYLIYNKDMNILLVHKKRGQIYGKKYIKNYWEMCDFRNYLGYSIIWSRTYNYKF